MMPLKSISTDQQEIWAKNWQGQRLQSCYQVPSNIALVKYWGKVGPQIPGNPSLSMTLEECHTLTQMVVMPRQEGVPWVEFFFDDRPQESFAKKIEKWLTELSLDIPFLTKMSFSIKSRNSFPHSAGIASSASGMGALSACLGDILGQLHGEKMPLPIVSHWARLGSGSASRSVMGPFAWWGEGSLDNSNNQYAIVAPKVHESFMGMHDSIVMVSQSEKKVSSTQGHALMDHHPYKDVRYQQASANCERLYSIMKAGDWDAFIPLVEKEALELHGLMMNSDPSFILMEGTSLDIIHQVRNFRADTGLPLTFTMDAGPNVHLLYPKEYYRKIRPFIDNEILPLTEEQNCIHDYMGMGPVVKEWH